MKRGRIVEQGTHDELMQRPAGAYSVLVQMQQQDGGASDDDGGDGDLLDEEPLGAIAEVGWAGEVVLTGFSP